MSLLKRLDMQKNNDMKKHSIQGDVQNPPSPDGDKKALFQDIKQQALSTIIDEIDPKTIQKADEKKDTTDLENEITTIVDRFLGDQDIFIGRTEKNKLIAEVI